MSFYSKTCALVSKTATFLADRFIVKPIQGLCEVIDGVALAAPELVRATYQAIAQAIRKQLSPWGRLRVLAGLTQVASGAKRLLWPACLVALIWIGSSAAGVLVLAVGFWLLMVNMAWKYSGLQQEAVFRKFDPEAKEAGLRQVFSSWN